MNQTVVAERPVQLYPAADCWAIDNGRVYLIGSRCRSCQKHVFPRRTWCDACDGDPSMEDVRLSPTGTLYTFSEVHVAPSVFVTPYVVGYVDLLDGVRVFGQIEHRPSELTLGDQLEVVVGTIRTTPDGEEVVSYKFRMSEGARHA